MSLLRTCLWFDGNAEDAVDLYASLFRDCRIDQKTYYPSGAHMPEGTLLTVEFTLMGDAFMALNAGPQYKHSPAVSFMIPCKDQAEIDRYWQALGEGGETHACGWISDRFGVCWQIMPEEMMEWTSPSDPERRARVFAAMMEMIKLDKEELRRAAEDPNPE